MRSKVYFIRCGDYVRIGVSRRPALRLAEVDRHSPYLPILVAAVPGDRVMRDEIHELCELYHVRGSWFLWAGVVGTLSLCGYSFDLNYGSAPRQRLEPASAGVQPAQ